MKSFCFIDVETTGLKPSKNDIVQLACIPVVDGVPQEPFNEFCQPMDYFSVDAEATAVHGITVERMRTFQTPLVMLEKLQRHLSQYGVKFTLAGYNVDFDKSFVGAFFAKQHRSQLYKDLFTNEIHDVYARAKSIKTKLKSSRLKLSNLAEEFGIEFKAHDALSDITATMAVDKRISALMGDEDNEVRHDDVVENIELPHPAYLHLHSEFSNTDSVATTEEWAKWALQRNVKAISFPDHTVAVSLFNSVNSKTIIDKVNKDLEATTGVKNRYAATDLTIIPAISIDVTMGENSDRFRLNAWATSNEGHFNLVKLASMGWTNVVDDHGVTIPVIPIDEVVARSVGLVFGTACELGVLNHRSLIGDPKATLKQLHAKLPKLFLEFLPFDMYRRYEPGVGFRSIPKSKDIPDGNLTKAINSVLWEYHRETGTPFIVSTAAHFIDPEDKMLQDVVSRASFKDGRYFYESRHQRTPQECLAVLKRHLPGFDAAHYIKAAETSYAVADAASAIKIQHPYHLPKIEIPEALIPKGDYDTQLYYLLMQKIKQHGRWSDEPAYVARFKKELDVIWKNAKLNFIPYFLMYEDLCRYARDVGILQNIGRGSAGGCLISYYLKIIHIDPVKENLPFERFLSHARINAGSWPDIDCDYGERGPLISYLKEKYGLGFAQVGTFMKFKTKNAIKDAMYAVFGRNRRDREIMDVCDTIPDSPQGVDEYDFLYGYVDSEGEEHRGLLDSNQVLRIFFQQYQEIEQIVKRLIGLPKDFGRHPSAFVLSTLDLGSERVPTSIMHDKETGPILVTQFEAQQVEKCGLVKADILGVTTISTISECVALIKERTGVDLLEEDDRGVQALYRLPEDSGVYGDFYKRKTDSSFQFNTDLIKGFLEQFAPRSRKDLSDLTALCRPGALDVEFLPGVSATQFFLDARNGLREPEYVHPDLELVLKETNGVVVYQEQLMQILVEFCGYSLEESDQIRSAIAKKKRDVMLKTYERIRESTVARGWTLEQADKLCQVMEAYSNYSLNRSHSRSYAELGYITMYLKHHYPLEWWCAELNNASEKKLRYYISVLGPLVSAPSLAHPNHRFTILGDKIAAPLSAIKGLGPSSIKELTKFGTFASLADFVAKAGNKIHIGYFGPMVRARAVDCFIDHTLPYAEGRRKMLEEYCKLKGIKSVPEDLYESDPLQLFLQERDTFKCFNRPLLADPEVRASVAKLWPALNATTSSSVPLYMGTVPVVGSVRAATIISDRLHDQASDPMEAGFVGFFLGSTYKQGLSKKSGRPWRKVDIVVSDGLSTMECTWWDHRTPLRYPTNSLIYIRGSLKKGWKSAPVIDVLEVAKAGDPIY